MPAYQFGEFHSIHVHAPPRVAYRAIRDVTADEIFLFRTLTWIRNPHLPGHGQENILNAPGKKPILEVAMRSGFRLLREEPDSEIVLGTVILSDGVSRIANPDEFRSFRQPGNVLATINFVVRDTGGGWCVVWTETRVLATDAASRRRFGVYWRMIYPGSWLIRLNWLRAIRRRAEAAPLSGLARLRNLSACLGDDNARGFVLGCRLGELRVKEFKEAARARPAVRAAPRHAQQENQQVE
jgi:hypothetical protein